MQRQWKRGQLKAIGLCCGLGLLATGFAVAQQPAAERAQQRDAQRQLGQQRQAQQQTGQKHFCLSTELIGMTVKGMGNEEVGQVKNLIITQEGQVQYLALSGEADRSAADRGTQDRTPQDRTPQDRAQQQRTPQTQQAGAEGQLTLVPWELAKFHAGPTKTESFVSVQIEKDRLMNAPSFGEEQLTAAQGQAQVIAQVDQFFNIRERRGAARPELNRERDQQDQNRREIPTQREQRQPDAN